MSEAKEKKKWFMSVLRKDIKLLYSAIFSGVLVALMGVAVSVFSQKLIDDILPSKNNNYLLLGLGVVAGLLVLKISLSYLQQFMGLKHGMKFNIRLISTFFSHLMRLPKKFYDEQQTGGLISRMNDSGAIHQTISYIANTLVLNTLILVVSSAVLFYYSVVAGIIAFMSMPFHIMIAYYYKSKLAESNYMAMDSNAKKENNYITTIQNIDLVKVHNNQERLCALNSDSYDLFQERSFLVGKQGMSLGIIAEGIGTFAYLVILVFSSFQVVKGDITVGYFMATMGIATTMLQPIAEVGMSVLRLQGARVAFDRMYEFISEPKEYDESADRKKNESDHIQNLEFAEVGFYYDSSNPVLQDINFSLQSGEIVTLFGRNGSGKSTILNLIVGLYQAQKGEILINGMSASKFSLESIRKKIAIVSQHSKLFDTNIINNIIFHGGQAHDQAIQYLNQLGFEQFINRLPNGYYTEVQENGTNLSGGQKQIISLARAMLKKPSVLLLDEPTASLDNTSKEFVMSIIRKFSTNGIVLMVTHDIREAKLASRIIVLENGEITDQGSHESLMMRSNAYSRIKEEMLIEINSI